MRELPYFQFEPAQYLAGNIQLCSLEAHGLFLNICCHYWMRECEMSKRELDKRCANRMDLLNELITETVIKISGDKVVIEFLIDQFEQISTQKANASKWGKKGAMIANLKRKKKGEAKTGPNVDYKPAESGTFFYIGMQQYKHAVSKYVLEHLQLTISEFIPTVLPEGREASVFVAEVLKTMDAECAGANFNDHEHVRNKFKAVARVLKATYISKGNGQQQAVVATIGNKANLDA